MDRKERYGRRVKWGGTSPSKESNSFFRAKRTLKLGALDLSGRSLSDSDLTTRWSATTKEAMKTLKLGNKIGMQIEGGELEVVRELALLEEN
ncbi:hypothetical protein V6N12_050413 [Hibiscus sabdariffa]|uniref:Uncharacterized protein n=1 Tax=Hibiscus sabdariffa TaxID=183260 RepID=A0ABR2GCS2_9ROSI